MQRVNTNSSDICRQLESWYEKPAGQHLAAQEKLLVGQQLDRVFGYRLLQLGITRNHPLGEYTRLDHRIYSAPCPGAAVDMLIEPDSLPFSNDSIDVVLLHHALEFAENPHALLREAHRVLAPQGHILILGFNPLSLFGIRLGIGRYWLGSCWRGARPMGIWRLRDWLRLLGTEVQSVRHSYALPPIGGERLFRYLRQSDRFLARHNVPIGGLYAIRARKQVSPLTPARLRWQKSMGSKLIGLTAPKPTPSSSVLPHQYASFRRAGQSRRQGAARR